MISNKTENIKNKRNQAKYTKIKPHKNFFFFKKEAKDQEKKHKLFLFGFWFREKLNKIKVNKL